MPIPEGSHSTSNTLEKLRRERMGALVNLSLISLKAAWACSFQFKHLVLEYFGYRGQY